MKKHLRPLLLPLASLSLLLCLATTLLWTLSLFRSETLGWAGWRNQPAQIWHGLGLYSTRGHLLVYYFTADGVRFDDPSHIDGYNHPNMPPHVFHHTYPSSPPQSPPFYARIIHSPFHLYFAAAPHWLIFLLLAILPSSFAIPRLLPLLSRRPQEGLCPTCHYDLRATPTRCPECGTPIPIQPPNLSTP